MAGSHLKGTTSLFKFWALGQLLFPHWQMYSLLRLCLSLMHFKNLTLYHKTLHLEYTCEFFHLSLVGCNALSPLWKSCSVQCLFCHLHLAQGYQQCYPYSSGKSKTVLDKVGLFKVECFRHENSYKLFIRIANAARVFFKTSYWMHNKTSFCTFPRQSWIIFL